VPKSFSPTADDLRMLSEHLCYEVDMTYGSAAWMLGMAANADPVSQNAVLESFTIHLRQLIDFFWPENPRRSGDTPDAVAADFFDEGEWESLCPERPEILSEAIRKKIGWGVAHLTYGRARAKPEDKPWQFVALAHALAPAILAFVDNVDKTKLNPDDVERMKTHAEAWGGRGDDPGAMQYLSHHT
jgi:hypothetical protein